MIRDSLFLVFVCLCLGVTLYAVKVDTADDLINLFSNATGGVLKDDIELAADLDFSGYTLTLPLGAFPNGTCVAYSGVFQGNNFCIKGLKMNTNNEGYNHAGLFCELKDATVENLVIDSSCSFTGNQSGGLSVTASGSLNIRNVTNNASVNGLEFAGGFIAYMEEREKETVQVSFSDCTNNVMINGTDSAAGFINHVERNSYMTITFNSCNNSGIVQGNENSSGFIGRISGNDQMTIAIIKCNNMQMQ